mgnify:CR=1 FL=1
MKKFVYILLYLYGSILNAQNETNTWTLNVSSNYSLEHYSSKYQLSSRIYAISDNTIFDLNYLSFSFKKYLKNKNSLEFELMPFHFYIYEVNWSIEDYNNSNTVFSNSTNHHIQSYVNAYYNFELYKSKDYRFFNPFIGVKLGIIYNNEKITPMFYTLFKYSLLTDLGISLGNSMHISDNLSFECSISSDIVHAGFDYIINTYTYSPVSLRKTLDKYVNFLPEYYNIRLGFKYNL